MKPPLFGSIEFLSLELYKLFSLVHDTRFYDPDVGILAFPEMSNSLIMFLYRDPSYRS